MHTRIQPLLIAGLTALIGLAAAQPAQAFFFCPPFMSDSKSRLPEGRNYPSRGYAHGGQGYAWMPPNGAGPIRPWSYYESGEYLQQAPPVPPIETSGAGSKVSR